MIQKRYVVVIFSLFLLLILGLYFVPSVFGGHSITEHSVIRYTSPNQDGEVVFEQKYQDKKVVIWDTGNRKYVKLVENTWGPFHQSTESNVIRVSTRNEKMKFTWSASEIQTEKKDKFYDSIFAAEVLDSDIEKVIVSNEIDDDKNTSLETVKEQSTVFIEMDVEEGFAAHYSKLPDSDVGSFSFRGINGAGEVVSFD